MIESCKNALKRTFVALKQNGLNYDAYEDLFVIVQFGLLHDAEHKFEYKKYSDYVKEIALKEVKDDADHAEIWRDLYWRMLKLESFYFFESFLLYMERKRPYEKRFYEPRQKTLKTVVDELQKLEDSKTQKCLAISMPARVGKSTSILFFKAWVALRHPESHSAMGTHSGMLADHFYKELLDIFTTEEYCFQELYAYFQPNKKFIEDKSAEKMTISFAAKGDFPTITCRGIDGTWTGAIDISSDGYLTVDDLVRDRTHSLSPKRMNDTFSEFLNKMVDRMNDGAKMLLIGTLWNVLDPIKRLEEMYSDDDRYVFMRIPALNDEDESNFDYEVKGFSTEYYKEMRDRLIRAGNEAEWFAKYQQAPYNREGLLFPANELGLFNGVLLSDKSYTFQVICDPAFGGGDSVSMPVGLQDDETKIIYVIDWYFSSAGVKVTIPEVADMIVKYEIKNVTFERNSGGMLYAKQVQEELEKREYLCACDTKRAPNGIDKISKIKACETKIKEFVRFLDDSKPNVEGGEEVMVFKKTPMYKRALDEMETFVTIGKNLHDDAADGIAQMVMKAFDSINRQTVVIDSPF